MPRLQKFERFIKNVERTDDPNDQIRPVIKKNYRDVWSLWKRTRRSTESEIETLFLSHKSGVVQRLCFSLTNPLSLSLISLKRQTLVLIPYKTTGLAPLYVAYAISQTILLFSVPCRQVQSKLKHLVAKVIRSRCFGWPALVVALWTWWWAIKQVRVRAGLVLFWSSELWAGTMQYLLKQNSPTDKVKRN
jgi:hypothetical protein